jgi:hypothetical protein
MRRQPISEITLIIQDIYLAQMKVERHQGHVLRRFGIALCGGPLAWAAYPWAMKSPRLHADEIFPAVPVSETIKYRVWESGDFLRDRDQK